MDLRKIQICRIAKRYEILITLRRLSVFDLNLPNNMTSLLEKATALYRSFTPYSCYIFNGKMHTIVRLY